MPRTRRSHPSDLTDEEWNPFQPLLASPEKQGRSPKWPARRVADGRALLAEKRPGLSDAAARICTMADLMRILGAP
jgi:transposase